MPVMLTSPELQNAWLHQDSLAKELLELADSTPYQALELAG